MKSIFKSIVVFFVISALFVIPARAVNQIHGTVVPGTSSNNVNIVLTANYSSVTGEWVNSAVLCIAIPTIAGESVAITGVGNFAGLALAYTTEVIGSETMYEWQVTQPTAPSTTMAWTSGVAFTVANVVFSGSVPSYVRLADRTNNTNNNAFFAMNTNKSPFDKTDYNAQFYAVSGQSTIADYTGGGGDRYAQVIAAATVNQIHGTLVPGANGNNVNIVLTANYTSVTGEWVNSAVLCIAIPTTAGEVVTITGVGNFAGLALAYTTEVIGSETMYEWQVTQPTAPSTTMAWTAGTPFTVANVVFTNSNTAKNATYVRLADRTNNTNNNAFFAMNTNKTPFDKTDYTAQFYAVSGQSTIANYTGGGGDRYAQTVGTIILPSVLTNFSGEATGCNANLAWQTATEGNSSYYAVEYGTDGSTFTEVGKVASKNSAVGTAYNYQYNNMVSGTNFFRLRIVDLDASYAYSSVISVKGNGACSGLVVKVSPNPTSDELTVTGIITGSYLTLFDGGGKLMTKVLSTGNSQLLSLGSYVKGMYTLRVQTPSGTVSTVKVIKK